MLNVAILGPEVENNNREFFTFLWQRRLKSKE